MLNKELTYIGKKSMVSDRLPGYVLTLQESSEYSDRLMSVLISQMKKKEGCSGAEEDFKVWRNPIESIAKELIVKASQSGVYDLTKEEMVDNNPAFKQLHEICAQCLEGMKLVLMRAMNDWVDGYDNAYNSAARNIKGPGFGILTNSFASAVLYEAVAYSALKQQARQADREFSLSLDRLNASNQNRREIENAKVLAEYYSDAKNTIPSIIANMMEVYFAKVRLCGCHRFIGF